MFFCKETSFYPYFPQFKPSVSATHINKAPKGYLKPLGANEGLFNYSEMDMLPKNQCPKAVFDHPFTLS